LTATAHIRDYPTQTRALRLHRGDNIWWNRGTKQRETRVRCPTGRESHCKREKQQHREHQNRTERIDGWRSNRESDVYISNRDKREWKSNETAKQRDSDRERERSETARQRDRERESSETRMRSSRVGCRQRERREKRVERGNKRAGAAGGESW
jgi:hypothetical protein